MLNLGCTVPAGQAARAGHLRGCADPLAQKKPCDQIINNRQRSHWVLPLTSPHIHSAVCCRQVEQGTFGETQRRKVP